MTETVYSSDAELRHPARFLADAGDELRRSPAVAWRLFRSSVQARHRRAWLGYLWLLLPTLGTTAVWAYVRSRGLIETGATAVPYLVYALSGTILWQVFADSLVSPLQQLTASRQLITRSRVPHEAFILAGVFDTLLNCAVRLLLLACVMLAFGVPVGREVMLVPFGIAALALLGVTLGLFAAPLGLLYDDVGRALTMLAGFWFFLTPVVYPTPTRGLLRFNPVTPLLETTRQWLTSGAPLGRFVAVTSGAAAALVVAWLLHRLARPHVVARLG
ncbi:MAG TPA: ABC transporter permease [Thermoanaerobaculia bacterium]